MFLRALHKKIFVLSFIFFLAVWYVLSAGNVLGFNLFSAWTYKQGNIKIGENYVREDAIDDTIVGLVIANMTFGEGEYETGNEQSLQEALSLFETSQALVGVDILTLVTNSPNPEEVLDAHLQHTTSIVAKIHAVAGSLQEMANVYLQKSSTCLSEKQEGDQLFFQGVNTNDAPHTAEGLSLSLAAAPCYITNRVKANAYVYMAQRVATYQSILLRRQQLLENNADLIINNTAYLEGNTLEQLISLRNEITRVNSVSYQEVEGLLNFNIFNANRDVNDLPDYNQVFFASDEMPRFGNSGGNPLGY